MESFVSRVTCILVLKCCSSTCEVLKFSISLRSLVCDYVVLRKFYHVYIVLHLFQYDPTLFYNVDCSDWFCEVSERAMGC